MDAIQLYDKFSEELIGTILITHKNPTELIQKAWREFQQTRNSNNEKEWDIYDFINAYPSMDMEIVNLEFYQP